MILPVGQVIKVWRHYFHLAKLDGFVELDVNIVKGFAGES
jgi:hypothetical protein